MAKLRLLFLGSPLIELDGQAVQTDRRKAVALLAYLAVSGQPQRRDGLAALFWPDYEPDRALAYLRRALWEVHQMIGEGWVQAGRDDVRLDTTSDLFIDVYEFEQQLEKVRGKGADVVAALDEAARLYRGDFLAGFSLRDSPEFDDWQVNRAEHYRRRLGESLERLARIRVGAGQVEQAEDPALRLERLDPLNEASHRLLMEVYARSGQRSAAIRQYERCVQLLRDELSARPEPATTALYEKIRTGSFEPGVTVAVAAPPLTPDFSRAKPMRLPLPASPFIGRKAELAEVGYMLAKPDCRLVTLYGPGGMGKTRLALQAAREQAAHFGDGVYFISLAALSDPDQVPAGLAAELGITLNEKVQQTDTRRQVMNYLRERQVLLVMDNFEHLVQAAGLLSDLLAEAPGVKILATSRERLNLPEEWTFELSGMSFPLNGGDELTGYSSAQLFLHHAQRAQAHFRPGDADRAAISRICRLLEGLPLGIELAAAWVKVLSCQEIAAEIESNLDFLETAQRGIPERHRSLRAVFDHSWQLLSPAEKQAFRRLAVFQGGFTKESAVKVTGVNLAQLSALADKSLVHRRVDGRYDLHEILHQYAAEKLSGSPGEQAVIRDAHRAYYLDLLVKMAQNLMGAGQKEALNLLAVESANVRAAWYRTVAQGSLDDLEKITPVIMMYFLLRSRHQEGMETIHPALERMRREYADTPEDSQVKALLVFMLAIYGSFQVQLGQAEGAALLDEAISMAPSLPAGLIKAHASTLLGFGFDRLSPEVVEEWYHETLATLSEKQEAMGYAMAQFTYGGYLQGRLLVTQARSVYQEALEGFTRLWNRWGMALCFQSLSNVAYWVGDYLEACRLAREALEVYADLGDPWRKMELNLSLGQALTAQGEYLEARRCFQDAMEFASHMGNRYLKAVSLDSLAGIENFEGNYAAAQETGRHSLEIYRQIHNAPGAGLAMIHLGDSAKGLGNLVEARRIYNEALAILSAHGMVWGRSKCLKMLGWLDMLEGDLAAADQALRQALAIAANVDRPSYMLEIIELRAELHARHGNYSRGLTMLTCLAANPAMTAAVRQRTLALEEELMGKMGSEAIEAAQDEGCGRSLTDLVAMEMQG